MEILEAGIPTYVLLILAPVGVAIFAAWKLKLNVVNCIASCICVASLSSMGFAIGEMSSYTEKNIEIDQKWLEGVTINGNPVSTDGDISVTVYRQTEPILTWSQSFMLLFTSIGTFAVGFFWFFCEDAALKGRTGRHNI